MNIAVILSGGSGVRFGSDTPKQYHLLQYKEIIGYVFDAINQSKATDKTLIVSERNLKYKADYTQGGQTHNESVANALTHIKNEYPTCTKILFADAARPLLTSEVVDNYFNILNDHDAVITTQYITDSLGKSGERFVDRSDYFLIQKPEAFRFEPLIDYFDIKSPKTAIVQHLPDNANVYNYFDFGNNIKITYPGDIELAAQFMISRKGEQTI